MNLWFRLLITLLLSLLRKRAGLFETTVTRFRVLPNDLDFNGHMNNGRYMTLADLGRLDFVVRTGSAAIAIDNRAWPVVGDVTAKFRKGSGSFSAMRFTPGCSDGMTDGPSWSIASSASDALPR